MCQKRNTLVGPNCWNTPRGLQKHLDFTRKLCLKQRFSASTGKKIVRHTRSKQTTTTRSVHALLWVLLDRYIDRNYQGFRALKPSRVIVSILVAGTTNIPV